MLTDAHNYYIPTANDSVNLVQKKSFFALNSVKQAQKFALLITYNGFQYLLISMPKAFNFYEV